MARGFEGDESAPAAHPARRAIAPPATESRWFAPDGHAIRRIDWPGSGRGSILFLPGRGDTYEKYLEALAQWHEAGWQVTALDWRGQAGSGRLGNDAVTGHIGDFADWVADLGAFWAEWAKLTPGPHVLAGHSMGGHIALRALVDGAVSPDALVLSAPMLAFLPGWLPTRVQHWFAAARARHGDPRRPAWKWSEKPGALPSGRDALLTHDAGRYSDEAWWRDARPELVMGPGSWGWVERALASIGRLEAPGVLEAVQTPVLLLGTRYDKLVAWRGIADAARRLPHAELVDYGAEARHEILREADPVRGRVMADIAAFLDRTARPRESGAA